MQSTSAERQNIIAALRKNTCTTELKLNQLLFRRTPFSHERTTENKLWLFRLGYWADICSRVNEVILSFQGIQLTVFAVNEKFNLFRENYIFKKLVFATMSLRASQYLKNFMMKLVTI